MREKIVYLLALKHNRARVLQIVRLQDSRSGEMQKVGARLAFCVVAGVAQLVEQLICNQQVAGSNPIASSSHMRVGSEVVKRIRL